MSACESCGSTMDKYDRSAVDRRYCMNCQDQNTGDLTDYEEVAAMNVIAEVELSGVSKAEAEEIVRDRMDKLPRWQ